MATILGLDVNTTFQRQENQGPEKAHNTLSHHRWDENTSCLLPPATGEGLPKAHAAVMDLSVLIVYLPFKFHAIPSFPVNLGTQGHWQREVLGLAQITPPLSITTS